VRFAGHKTLVDLRKCEDGWSMAPGESVVAFSNEWLQLPDDIVALIISRVSHYNNGLVVSASYLDSTWEGLVKLHITNFSGRTIRIQLGSELARLFLLTASDGSPDDHSVARQGIHYGITWPRILEDGIDPFPVSSFPREPFASARLRNTNELLKNYAGYGLLTLLILGGAAATQLYYRLSTASNVARRTSAIERTLGDLRNRQLVSGTETVTVKPGARTAISDITLPATLRGHLGSAFVLANAQDAAKEARVSASLVQVGNSPALRLDVHVTRSTQAQTTVNVQWLVAP
jgi:dUTPase